MLHLHAKTAKLLRTTGSALEAVRASAEAPLPRVKTIPDRRTIEHQQAQDARPQTARFSLTTFRSNKTPKEVQFSVRVVCHSSQFLYKHT